ncbi:hypothetical protein BUALT_Bualt05G0129600 [Buddleja alternifolia]|uniref:Uncharacterized protein n=1 Tax=Buddleja alternifolia TaxID=168488 RepID=A0AAV6XIR8_9LAMI|nr:hypothetical protein BUALT_Bualt05G0129600 [Buddleja alternifolia]
MDDLKVRKRVRDESPASDVDSPEVKRLREDLLDFDDDAADFCTTSQDLDSFMKSFEVEIAASAAAEVVDLTSDGGGESRPDLGYLLEASDDDLGLPPSTDGGLGSELKTEKGRVESDASELGGEFWEIPNSYDSFGFGFGESEYYNNGGEYVALDGLFDYSDLGFGSSDFSRRPETLPAQ